MKSKTEGRQGLMLGRQEYAAAMGEAAGDLGGVCGHGRVEEREIGNLGDP